MVARQLLFGRRVVTKLKSWACVAAQVAQRRGRLVTELHKV